MAKLLYNSKMYEGTTEELAIDETVYQSNDLIYDTDLNILKKGNGVDKYADLPTIGGGEAPVDPEE